MCGRKRQDGTEQDAGRVPLRTDGMSYLAFNDRKGIKSSKDRCAQQRKIAFSTPKRAGWWRWRDDGLP